MINFEFDPDSLAINEGDTVRWINQTPTIHTTTSGTSGVHDSIWDSGNLALGDSFSFVFDTLVGAFPYFCRPHWSMGMTGIIISQPAGMQEEEERIAPEPSLLKAFPNPFRETVHISFNIAIPGNANLSIYDLSGRRLKTVHFSVDRAGPFEYLWDGKDEKGMEMRRGIYFARLSSSSGSSYHKMLKMD
jgi:hypothetical protein